MPDAMTFLANITSAAWHHVEEAPSAAMLARAMFMQAKRYRCAAGYRANSCAAARALGLFDIIASSVCVSGRRCDEPRQEVREWRRRTAAEIIIT